MWVWHQVCHIEYTDGCFAGVGTGADGAGGFADVPVISGGGGGGGFTLFGAWHAPASVTVAVGCLTWGGIVACNPGGGALALRGGSLTWGAVDGNPGGGGLAFWQPGSCLTWGSVCGNPGGGGLAFWLGPAGGGGFTGLPVPVGRCEATWGGGGLNAAVLTGGFSAGTAIGS